jgi:hypothetical protein
MLALYPREMVLAGGPSPRLHLSDLGQTFVSGTGRTYTAAQLVRAVYGAALPISPIAIQNCGVSARLR